MSLRPKFPLLFTLVLAGAISAGVLASPARAQQQPPTYTVSPPTQAERARVSETVVRYLEIWNERDPDRRRQMMSEVLTEDALYTDPNRQGGGYESLDALISGAHRFFPEPYALRLVSTIEIHHGYARFSWAAGGIAGAPLYLAGTDFIVLADDGRIRSIVGFADAPAVALPTRG